MHLIRISIIAAALALGGCATPAGTGPSPTTPTAVVNQVIALSQQICKFVPTVNTVLGLLTANPAWTTAADFAVAICNAVTAKGGVHTNRRGVPMIGNVAINGRFVR